MVRKVKRLDKTHLQHKSYGWPTVKNQRTRDLMQCAVNTWNVECGWTQSRVTS